jgi:hypothetical protein
MSLNTGDDLVFQPTGYGVGTTTWGFESQAVESDMELAGHSDNLESDGTMDNDYVTSGTPTVLQDLAGNPFTTNGGGNYDLPQTALDPTYTVRIDGGSMTRYNSEATGSVTIEP